MPPPSPERSASPISLRYRIPSLIPNELIVRGSQPVTVPPNSEPEPDLCIVRRNADHYKSAHPGPKDVLL